MRKLPTLILTTLILALLGATFQAALAAGGASAPSAADSSADVGVSKTPEQMAADSYNAGLRLRDKAWKLEEKAEAASGAERDKLLAKAQKQYEKAIERYIKATQYNPSMHQAFSSLGYALRRTGKFESSLRAYDKALALAPDYSEAIEYRAEAFLGLNRLDEAKKSYMYLFSHDRPRADELLEAMQTWIEERRQDPAGVAGDELESFAAWVDERAEVAEQVTDASVGAESWGD